MADFKKLRVWRKAHALTLNAHRTISKPDYASTISQLVDVRRMLHGLIAKLQSSKTKKPPVHSPERKAKSD